VVIRTTIGFDGLLDERRPVDEGAVAAISRQRAEDALRADCDVVLHCNGDMAEMKAVGRWDPRAEGQGEKRRAQAALARIAQRRRAFRRRRSPGPLRRGVTAGPQRPRKDMSTGFQPSLDFAAADNAAEDGEALIVDIDGYEGPLHVLLALARNQKVDLLQLSILKLAEQYLAFVQQAAACDSRWPPTISSWRLAGLSEIAPAAAQARTAQGRGAAGRGDGPALAFRLAKLDAMRKAVEALKTGRSWAATCSAAAIPRRSSIISSTRSRATSTA
jgi:hypothetical protein